MQQQNIGKYKPHIVAKSRGLSLLTGGQAMA